MALVARGGMQRLGMAGPATVAAMVHAAAAFIGDPRVGSAVFRRPIFDRMAGGTIQSEQAGMVGRVTMAVRADCGQPGKLAGGMTVLAGHICMPAYQREPGKVVIEIGILPVRGVMAGRAVGAILARVLVILLVAGIAVRGSAQENPVEMTGFTRSFKVLSLQLEDR